MSMSLPGFSSPREHDPKSQALVTGWVDRNARILGIKLEISELIIIDRRFLQR